MDDLIPSFLKWDGKRRKNKTHPKQKEADMPRYSKDLSNNRDLIRFLMLNLRGIDDPADVRETVEGILYREDPLEVAEVIEEIMRLKQ